MNIRRVSRRMARQDGRPIRTDAVVPQKSLGNNERCLTRGRPFDTPALGPATRDEIRTPAGIDGIELSTTSPKSPWRSWRRWRFTRFPIADA
jgi:hypothetical protein